MCLCVLVRHKNKNKNDVDFVGQVFYAYLLLRICANLLPFLYFYKSAFPVNQQLLMVRYLDSYHRVFQGKVLSRLPCGHYVRSEPRRLAMDLRRAGHLVRRGARSDSGAGRHCGAPPGATAEHRRVFAGSLLALLTPAARRGGERTVDCNSW